MTPAAREELREAYDFYESRQAGLGADFGKEMARAAANVRAHPLRWPAIDSRTRKCSANRFPYALRVEGDVVSVIAVMDLQRRPGYWRDRT
jgi:toxin ParE1/3/4